MRSETKIHGGLSAAGLQTTSLRAQRSELRPDEVVDQRGLLGSGTLSGTLVASFEKNAATRVIGELYAAKQE